MPQSLSRSLLPYSGFLALLLIVLSAHPVSAEDSRQQAPGTAMDAGLLERVNAATVFIQASWQSYFDASDAPERKQASGSGFVVDAQRGLVVTNWHVVDGYAEEGEAQFPLRRKQLQVILHSGSPQQRAYPAMVVAADPEEDLAVLHIAAKDLEYLSLGSSEGVRKTTPVWLAGFPFGALFSVLQRGPSISINRGHVSSLRRDDMQRLQRIQFDAATNRGNSGGPLLGEDGKVYGIANMALGTSRVNFAIPVDVLGRLLATIPDSFTGEKVDLTITSDPSPALLRIGLDHTGETPLQLTLAPEWQHVSATSPNHWVDGSWRRADSESPWHIPFTPLPVTDLRLRQRQHPVPGGALQASDRVLWQEDFSDENAIADWAQETGGSEHSRTWYVDAGVLHQSADTGMLHAIFAGQEAWRNYSFSADMRIARNRQDGRAGLMVRAGDDGFILVRLHSQRQIVQVAQHVRRPFGWTILAERALPVEQEQWYTLTLQVHGRYLVASVDDTPVIETILPDGPTGVSGNVGFYAVDTAAEFRNPQVHEISQEAPLIDPDLAALHSYWFSENFLSSHGRWMAMRAGQAVAPWAFVPGALLQLEKHDDLNLNLLHRYLVHDLQLQGLFAVADGSAGIILRGDGQEGIAAIVNRRAESLQLIHYQGDQIQVLARTGLPDQEREHRYHLVARLIGDEVLVMLDNRHRLQARAIPVEEGHLGVLTHDGGRAMFHMLSVSSP